MWQYLRKGTTWGQCKHVGENSCEVDISRNHRLLHHWNLQRIPYLHTKFEARTAFLRVKRGRTVSLPRSFCSCSEYTGNVTHTEYNNVYRYTGKDPVLSVFIAILNQIALKKKCLKPLNQYNLHNCQTTFPRERFRPMKPLKSFRMYGVADAVKTILEFSEDKEAILGLMTKQLLQLKLLDTEKKRRRCCHRWASVSPERCSVFSCRPVQLHMVGVLQFRATTLASGSPSEESASVQLDGV